MSKRNNSDHLYSPPENLKETLAEYPSGTWVAISQDQRTIVGAGPTPARAERQAEAAGYQPTLLMQVPSQRSKPVRNGNGNGHANGKQLPMPLNLPSFYRGIYKRVARKLGCDPSYVSRVARGERTSEQVSHALQAELTHALFLTNKNNNGTRLRGGQA
jgi:hypothetical protein